MTTHLRIFYALLWKEFREALPVWLIGLVGCIFFPLYILSKAKIPFQDISYAYREISVIPAIGLSFILFLPLLSREPERGTLPCLMTKPISPEQIGFYNWLATLFLGLIPLFAFSLSIFFGSGAFHGGYFNVSHEDIPRLWYNFSMRQFGTAATIFTLFSLLFMLVSSLTANRLRSFGLFLISTFAIAICTNYLYTRYGDSTQPSLFSKIEFFFGINPRFASLFIGVFALISILALVRLRMTHRLQYWPIYVGTTALLFLCFFYAVHLNVKSVNAVQLKIDPNQYSTSLLENLETREVDPRNMNPDNLTPRSDALIHQVFNGLIPQPIRISEATETAPIVGYSGYKFANVEGAHLDFNEPTYRRWDAGSVQPITDTAKLVIREYIGKPDPRILFQEELSTLFNASNLSMNQDYQRYYVWNNATPWKIAQGPAAGLIFVDSPFAISLVDEYCRRYNVERSHFRFLWAPWDEAGVDIIEDMTETRLFKYYQEKYSDFIEFVKNSYGEDITDLITRDFDPRRYLRTHFIGHFSISENPQFTPVEKIRLVYYNQDGQKTSEVIAAEPGVFDATMFKTQLKDELREVGNFVNDQYVSNFLHSIKDPIEQFHFGKFNHLLFQLQESYYSKLWKGNRFYFLTRFWGDTSTPTLLCYDLSDSKVFTIYIGCKYLEPFNQLHWNFANQITIIGDRMIFVRKEYGDSIVSFIDISDPANMYELERLEQPLSYRLTNWPLSSSYDNYGGSIEMYDDLLLIRGSNTFAFYKITDDNRLEPYARYVFPNNFRQIKKYRFDGKELWIMTDQFLVERYAIGPTTQEVETGTPEQLFIQQTAAYQHVIEVLKKQASEGRNIQ